MISRDFILHFHSDMFSCSPPPPPPLYFLQNVLHQNLRELIPHQLYPGFVETKYNGHYKLQ